MSIYPKTLLAGILAFGLFVGGGIGPLFAGTVTVETDMVDTAVAAGSFETPVTALEAADLVETRMGERTFTVFAPTDAAFAKLPRAQLDALPAAKEALTAR